MLSVPDPRCAVEERNRCRQAIALQTAGIAPNSEATPHAVVQDGHLMVDPEQIRSGPERIFRAWD